MRLYNIYGKLVHKNLSKYLIKWDAPCKSKLQFGVKQFLKPYWKSMVCYEECPVYGCLLRVDMINATLRIAVEVNGPQHSEFHYFHNKHPGEYLNSIKRDMKKIDWLEKNEFKIVEINHDEVDLLSRQFFKEKFDIDL